MSKVIRKLYFNHEIEEKWLNEMAEKGFAMNSYSWGRYTFDKCEPGEYIYRIELLEHSIKDERSQSYIEFLAENGIQLVSSYLNWVYLRKKATDEDFDLYSDLDSQIKHYQRISTLLTVLGCSTLVGGFTNIINGLTTDSDLSTFITIIGSLCTLFSILMIRLSYPLLQKVRDLKKERNLRE